MSDVPAPFQGLAADAKDTHVVWDRFVRLFHWGLVASVGTAMVSGFLLEASWIRVHLVSGSVAVALIVARIVWGFTGPAYARFSQFLPSYRDVMQHLSAGATHRRHIGHNPLGALMVLALLALIAGLGMTGAAALGAGLKSGPLATLLPATQGEFWTELHETAGVALLVLVALHVGGVIFESRRNDENLARAMVTGRKDRRAGDLTAPPRTAHLALATVVSVGLIVGTAAAIGGFSQRPLPLPPVDEIPQVYNDECAACHMAYHPSLRSAASWQRMMDGLDDHFGEDASLPRDTSKDITGWLVRNAAGTVDSKPATLWTVLQETKPVALPDTQVWQHVHEAVAPNTFRQRNIYSQSNCAACHKDAETGWFSPFQISVPKEPTQ